MLQNAYLIIVSFFIEMVEKKLIEKYIYSDQVLTLTCDVNFVLSSYLNLRVNETSNSVKNSMQGF